MNVNLKVTAGNYKGKVQEVQGVMVQKVGNEFEFNFQTARNPEKDEIELLKNFRNKFIGELEAINIILGINKE